MDSSLFESLALRPELHTSIASIGYTTMTPVQCEALPPVLQGRDVIAQAETGSGKTAAFAIGLLNKLDVQRYHTQALVMCPTRELAEQVAVEIRRLASAIGNVKVLTLCGGKPMGPQLASLQRDPHIVVGTPGRILKHIQKETLRLSSVQSLVLDEADRMLDMGFIEDISQIVSETPLSRQTLLFSATFPEEITTISEQVQTDPVEVRVASANNGPDIEQVFVRVGKKDKDAAVYKIIAHYRPESTLIFCNTIEQCNKLAKALREMDLHALALHGDMEQFERDQVLAQFAGKSSSILIATDVAARGLDVKELAAVVNFDISPDPQVHVHRIGRTGRAGEKGLALSLCLDSDKRKLGLIEDYQDAAANFVEATDYADVTKLKLYPPMVTLLVNAGRKDKIRAGDLLGSLTSNPDIAGSQIGKITLFDRVCYVAVQQEVAKLALSTLVEGKIKGRSFRARRLR